MCRIVGVVAKVVAARERQDRKLISLKTSEYSISTALVKPWLLVKGGDVSK